MAQKLDKNSWLFLYSQITAGLIGKQVLLDSSSGIIDNPIYGTGLFRATDSSGGVVVDKLTDNFYDITVKVLQNYLTPEITIQSNWYAESQSGQQTLLGYMSNPTVSGTQVNIIQFGDASGNPITNSTAQYHTLLFNNNSPAISCTVIVNYYLNNTNLAQQQSVTVNELGNFLFQLRNNILYDSIRVNFESNDSLQTNLVGLLQTGEPVTPDNLVCFGAGSMVFTPSGEIPIQNLTQGDHVYDENLNIQTVEFIAKRTVFPSKNLNKYSVPILIKQGQCGKNVPHTDTIVSSAHLIKHDGQMVPASSMGSELEYNTPITYYNVKVTNYSTMIVNGMVSETLDVSNDSKVYSKVYSQVY